MIDKAAKAAANRAYYLRTRPERTRRIGKDPNWRRAPRERAVRVRSVPMPQAPVDTRPNRCQRPGCGKGLVQPATGRRLYCNDRCRSRAFYAAHPGYGYTPGASIEPIPMPYVGHDVFAAAREAARLTSGTDYSVDWGQNDMMGEAVLAILEGRDPDEAVRRYRAKEKAADKVRAWRVEDVGWDGRQVIAQLGEDTRG